MFLIEICENSFRHLCEKVRQQMGFDLSTFEIYCFFLFIWQTVVLHTIGPLISSKALELRDNVIVASVNNSHLATITPFAITQ